MRERDVARGGNDEEKVPLRLVLAEDQRLVRSALVMLIEEEPDMTVVGECGRGDAAVDLVRAMSPDVALLDIDMPGMDGVQACAAIRSQSPACRCLLLTALDKPGLLQRALRSGAWGYVLKYAPVEEMLNAVRSVASGQRAVDSRLAVLALEHPEPGITDRELDLVELLSEGMEDREIARRLNLSHGTVRNYLSAVMAKVGARNRVDLVRIVEQGGWLLLRRSRPPTGPV